MRSSRRSLYLSLWLGVAGLGCGGGSEPGTAGDGSEAAPARAGVAAESPAAMTSDATPESEAAAKPQADTGNPGSQVGSGNDGVAAADVALDPGASPAGTEGSEMGASGDDPSSMARGEPTPGSSMRPEVDQATLPEVTLHLAGDSTVMKYAADSAQEGWGQELGQFLIDKVAIDNQAIGGASVQSFYASSRWRNITSGIEAGDYVMAAFGANDSGNVGDRHVDPPDYQAVFARMADEVEAKEATFILVTPSAMQEWRGGKAGNLRLGPYVAVLHELAPTKSLPLDDLNARSLEFLDTIGQAAAAEIYIGGDKAHFTKRGATQMAQLVAAELGRIGSPLAGYLK